MKFGFRDQLVRVWNLKSQVFCDFAQLLPLDGMQDKRHAHAFGQLVHAFQDDSKLVPRGHLHFWRRRFIGHDFGNLRQSGSLTLHLTLVDAAAVDRQIPHDPIEVAQGFGQRAAPLNRVNSLPCLLHYVFGVRTIANDAIGIVYQGATMRPI